MQTPQIGLLLQHAVRHGQACQHVTGIVAFDQPVVGTGGQGGLTVRNLAGVKHHHDVRLHAVDLSADALAQGNAVYPGRYAIDQNDLRRILPDAPESLHQIACFFDGMAACLQDVLQTCAYDRVIRSH